MSLRILLWVIVVGFAVAGLAVPARADDSAEQLIQATYKLANESSTATGTVICYEESDEGQSCLVVTANHVLAQMKGETCKLVSRKRRQVGYQRDEIEIPIRENGRVLWTKHPRFDLAVLPLPKSVAVTSLPLECLATDEQLVNVHTGDGVRLAVFPERAEANGAGFPLLRHGTIASFPVTPARPHPLLLVDTTSWTGDSGGPVIHESLTSQSGGPLILAVVTGMKNVTETRKESRFVESRTHYPLGITESLQVVLVRDVIEQLRKSRKKDDESDQN